MFHSDFEEELPYQLLTVLILVFFYGIYFGKMLIQRRRGIRTNQIGRRKEKGLHTVETLMKTATYAIVPVQLLSAAFGWSYLTANARFTGFLIGVLGDGVFLSAVVCMKDSWRAGIPEKDKTSIVTGGIYAYSRNPAFLGFDLMYFGIMLMFFNVLTVLFTAFAVVMLHLQILQEEKYMTAAFGKSYVDYKKRVFRYLGRKMQRK